MWQFANQHPEAFVILFLGLLFALVTISEHWADVYRSQLEEDLPESMEEEDDSDLEHEGQGKRND